MYRSVPLAVACLLPLSKVPLAGQSHVVAHDVLLAERPSVEGSVKAVEQVGLFASVLQQGSVCGLCGAVNHFLYRPFSAVEFGVLEVEGAAEHGGDRHLGEVSRVELEGLHEGVAVQVIIE